MGAGRKEEAIDLSTSRSRVFVVKEIGVLSDGQDFQKGSSDSDRTNDL